MEHLESMSDFFTARVEGYDEHMLRDVEGCKEGYQRMAQLVPEDTKNLLDLGCGTGLEICHFDTPCTIEYQISLLKAAGFQTVTRELRVGNTTILVARK